MLVSLIIVLVLRFMLMIFLVLIKVFYVKLKKKGHKGCRELMTLPFIYMCFFYICLHNKFDTNNKYCIFLFVYSFIERFSLFYTKLITFLLYLLFTGFN